MKSLTQKVLRHKWGRKGQSTAEYIIIVALVAIGSIALITIFGNQIREVFRASSEQLSGNNSAQATSQMGTANGTVTKGMNQF
ncbi:MAG: hypothetical protein HYU36_07375 [Planctomycetes bacterium]|nr:hypothetical protein [Planctomycetota bacterium]